MTLTLTVTLTLTLMTLTLTLTRMTLALTGDGGAGGGGGRSSAPRRREARSSSTLSTPRVERVTACVAHRRGRHGVMTGIRYARSRAFLAGFQSVAASLGASSSELSWSAPGQG